MKKLPYKYKYPLMISIVMPTMMLGLPALMTYYNLVEGALFVEQWMYTMGQVVPSALLMLLAIAGTVRLVVTKFLLESDPNS
jgi:hypothetical protein